MATRLALTAVYETVEGGWMQARVEELPAVITAAPTLDALWEYLLSLASEPSMPEGPGERVPLEIVISAA